MKKNAAFLLLNSLKDIICGHVRISIMLSIIFWTIYFQDLARNCTDKLQVFQWVLVADLFFFCYERDFMLPHVVSF